MTCANYSTMSILSTTLLHSSAIIDQVYETRTITAHAIANQFYGCFITTEKWSDLWLKKGVSKYLAGLFVKKMFGNNEYRDMIHKEMERVVRYEQRYGGIVLDSHIPPQTVTPSVVGQRGGRPERDDRVNVEDTFAFDPSNLNSCSPEWLEVRTVGYDMSFNYEFSGPTTFSCGDQFVGYGNNLSCTHLHSR